ncbi:Clusterin-associated protein [Schistosoma japonicum]|uniref:Clusterin-associated protein n=1 Tax=Schistosoma japonicum TaxID=6182 RepID=A0A4Z2CYX9_SCHJA|nr:Clusterin-associated protein [Schistosoma japonicum]
MSFREIRLFTEMMRSLGYPRIISLENFRTPNFALVAEILKWLVSRYTSYADLPSCLDSEHDRVLFIKTVTHVIFTNACIRLNSRRLYQADGFAVRELIKVAKILYEAFQSTDGSGDDQNTLNVTELIDADKVKQIQEAKCLCSQLASSGASLNSLLNKEVDIKELRDALLRRQIDGEYVERSLETAKNAISNQIDKIQLSLVNIAADETNLDAKIEKKRDELERNRKRLTTLQSVRPVYMDEYEQLEEKLSSLYTIYLMKFRNLTFLESQYEYLLHNTNQINGDTEITLKTIADHVKTSIQDDENHRNVSYYGDESIFKNRLDLNNKFDADNADASDDDDVEDDDEDDDDSISDQDDQNENDENDANIVAHSNSFRESDDVSITKYGFARNQLKSGWSPSRQRVPAASYRGRTQSSFNNDTFQANEASYQSIDMDGPRSNRSDFRLSKRSQQVSLQPITFIW